MDSSDSSDSSRNSSRSSTPGIVDTPATDISRTSSEIHREGYFENVEKTSSTPNEVVARPRSSIKNICCIGAGYVGGPTAAVIALKNPEITVNVADLNAARIRKWNSQHLPVHEPGLLDVVRAARNGIKGLTKLDERTPNLFFTTEVQRCVEEADLILMSVNTPTKMTGIGAGSATNLVSLESAVTSVAQWAKPGAVIVEKSTVPCRTAQMIRQTLDLHRPGVSFEVLSNPEFLAEGTAIKNLLNPDRILIGSTRTPEGYTAAAALKSVYAAWVDPTKIITVNLWSSELAKLVANAMLAQRISSINSISAVCEATGADINELSYAIGLDTRLGAKFLKAGLGFGGSCFKKDILNLVYMAHSLHLPEVGEYWLQVLKINDYQRERFVRNVVTRLHSTLMGKKIAILGWAFKEDTNDTRESPAIEVVKSLLADSPREIAIYDPGCTPDDMKEEVQQLVATPGQNLLSPVGPVTICGDALEACKNANAILILTPWDQFRFSAKSAKTSAFYDNCQSGKTSMECQSSGLTAKVQTLAASMTEPAVAELSCEDDCRECSRGHNEKRTYGGRIDWEQISESMKKPKWVFDGRGLVDRPNMEQLGFRVEAIGQVGLQSKLNGYDL